MLLVTISVEHVIAGVVVSQKAKSLLATTNGGFVELALADEVAVLLSIPLLDFGRVKSGYRPCRYNRCFKSLVEIQRTLKGVRHSGKEPCAREDASVSSAADPPPASPDPSLE